MAWENITNINEVEFKDNSFGENYKGQTAEIAEKMGAKQLGFHLEILQPKKFSCPYHFHHAEEELFLVLEGKAMLRQNGKYREIGEGDLIHFQNGPEGAHHFYNHTDQDFRFLALSTMDHSEVCEYPDSEKVYVAKIKKVFQHGKAVPYLTDEEEPSKYWVEEHLKS